MKWRALIFSMLLVCSTVTAFGCGDTANDGDECDNCDTDADCDSGLTCQSFTYEGVPDAIYLCASDSTDECDVL